MPESKMPRYLSHVLARELADELECAIASVRESFRKKHDAELAGLEHEISLALARAAVRYGVDLLPNTAAHALDRLEVAVAELEAKLEAARMAQAIEPARPNEYDPPTSSELEDHRRWHRARTESLRYTAPELVAREAQASAELAGAKAPPEWFASAVAQAQAVDFGHKPAKEAIRDLAIWGAGSLSDLAYLELRQYLDHRLVIEFDQAARVYFESVGLAVRKTEVDPASGRYVFHVGSGK